MKTTYYDKVTSFKLNDDLISKIDEVIAAKQEVYSSNSHFIRCAVIKLLREENAVKDVLKALEPKQKDTEEKPQ